VTRLFAYDCFSAIECAALVRYLQGRGAEFFSCLELGISPVPRGVSLRFDVHARDIVGSYGFLAALYRHNVPGTFYLLADYSTDEQARRADFLALVRRIKAPMEIGLHDSPVDSYLIARKFNGVGVEYWRWLQSDKSLEWFARLAESESGCECFNGEVMEAFAARVASMKRAFGDFRTMASHGGEINQMFRKRVPELGPTGEFLTSLFAENWITPERLSQAGLEADVEQFRKKAPLLYQVTDGGGLIKRMIDNAEMFIVGRNRAVQVLIHPYTWGGPLGHSGGTRDAEISTLLGEPKGESPRGGRAWYQRLLRTRVMIVPDGLGSQTANKAVPVRPPLPATAGGAIVCATVNDIQADVKYAGMPVAPRRVVVVEVGESAPERLGESVVTPLFDFMSASLVGAQSSPIVMGRSIGRYGPLVGGAVESLARRTDRASLTSSGAEQRLAEWMVQNLGGNNKETAQGGVPTLQRKELSYFMFSSSQRALIMKRIIDRFLSAQSISCLVDHGAGIGIIPLCANFACDGRIKRVVCSEVKHAFAVIGTHLWRDVGYEGVIEYQEGSVTDFVYPNQVAVVLLAQMCYRIAPEQRGTVIQAAWQALLPGGLLVINEMMDRDSRTLAHPLLTSKEMLAHLPEARERWLFWGSDSSNVVALPDADRQLFSRSDNFIVLRK